MEPTLLEDDESVDNCDIDELCEALKKSSDQIATLYEDTYTQFRGMRKKIKEEMHSMDKLPLKPKAHAKKWLEKHSLPENPTFEEVFGKICDELNKDHRLNIANRTLTPNKEIAKLFHVKADEPIHIFDFLMQAPEVFQ